MTALKWITNEAKKLKKQFPHRFKKWTDYVAQASAIYARKHGGSSPVGHKKKKRTVGKVHRKKTVTKKIHHVTHRKKTNTVAHHTAVAKKLLVDEIAKAEARKFTMKKKRDKKKQSKHIAHLKSKYRKLC